MLLSRLLVVAVLAVLVGLTSVPAHAGDGQRALALLPRDTTMVAAWNVARSRLSSVGVELVDVLADGRVISGTVQRLRRRMELTWQRDVDTVVLGMSANGANRGSLVMLIEGKVNRQTLLAAAQKERGFRAQVHRGIDYYQVGRAEIAYIDSFWVTARKGRMTRIIDIFRGQSQSVRRNKRVMELLGKVDVGRDMWCAFWIPEPMRESISSGGRIHTISANMDLRKRVRARIRLGLPDRTSVIAMGTWLRAQGPNEEHIKAMGLSQAVRKASLSRRGTSLDLLLTIPVDALPKLEAYLREYARGGDEPEEGS